MFKKFIEITKVLIFVIPGLSFSAHNFQVQAELVRQSLESNVHRLSPNSLNRFAKSIYSQYGEDGIIEEIFKRIGISKGFFVEFGANDGIWLSNSRNLWQKGWNGVMIEADLNAFKKLQANYPKNSNVLTIREFITWNESDQRGKLFSQIRAQYFPSREIDFLSIDIDGGDYFILKTLKCRPKVICIENGLKWHPLMKKEVPEFIAVHNLHQPLEIVIDYAEKIGYRAVCSTNNLFLVRKDFAHLFEEVPKDALTIYRDAFRALPNKDWWLYWRTSSQITSFEEDKFERQFPITYDF